MRSPDRSNSLEEQRQRTRKLSWLHILGLCFIALQGAAFVYAKFTPVRYFCWAPYDMHTHYSIEVSIHGRPLTPDEIEKRYHIPKQGFNPRSYVEVLGSVEQFETTYGRGDDAVVRIDYRVNGNPYPTWHYPREP